MTTSNVDFYEQMKVLQERQHESERKRMELDQQLNQGMRNSSNKLAKLKAVRLQNYWRKVCEDEKRSQARNEQLLLDIEKMEAHMATLAQRTQKLDQMKRQYEEYIENMYPNWKEKVMHYQKIRQEAEQRRIASSASMAAYAQVPQQVPYGIPSTQASNIPQPKQQVHAAEVHAGYYHPSAPGPQAAHTPLMGTNGGSTLQTVSTLPTGLSPGEFASDVLPDTQVNVPHTSPPDSVASSPRKSTPTPREGAKTPQDASSGRRQSKDIETAVEREGPVDSENEFSIGSPHHSVSHKSKSPSPTPRSPSRRSTERAPALAREESKDDSSIYLRPEVTFEGFDNMLTAIEEDLPAAHMPDDFYRTKMPAVSVRKEIIFNANKGAPLSYMDGSSISMVILDQLPLLVYYSCEGGFLLSDQMLFRPPPNLTEESIRVKVHPTCHSFWGRLFAHFVHLLKYEIMSPDEVASVFAPLMIAEDSPYEEKAKELLTQLLESVDPEEILHSPNSTSTFSTLPSAHKPKDHVMIPQEENEEDDDDERSEEGIQLRKQLSDASNRAPLQMPAVTVDDDVESPPVQNEADARVPLPAQSTGTPLTQTAAYRQLLGDTMSSQQKSMSYEASDDSSDDDIENQLGLTSPRNKPLRVEDAIPEGPKSVDDSATAPAAPSARPSWFAEMQRPSTAGAPSAQPAAQSSNLSKQAEGKEEARDELDPLSTGGYEPSALGTTGKSTVLSSTARSLGSTAAKGAKKPVFMFDSDTDTDVSLPGGRPSHKPHSEDSRDDFDFYD